MYPYGMIKYYVYQINSLSGDCKKGYLHTPKRSTSNGKYLS